MARANEGADAGKQACARTRIRGDVTNTHQLWQAKAGANVCSPSIYDGHLYWVSDRNTTTYCLNLESGDVVFTKRFPAQPYASPLIAGGKVYIVTRRKGTYVLAAQPKYQQLAHNSLDTEIQFNASPIISGGKLFLRNDEFLYCIGAQ